MSTPSIGTKVRALFDRRTLKDDATAGVVPGHQTRLAQPRQHLAPTRLIADTEPFRQPWDRRPRPESRHSLSLRRTIEESDQIEQSQLRSWTQP